MTGTELATAPRERFAERFALLYAEAGNPPLKRVTETVLRARTVDDQGRPVRVPAQRISDWRRGRNVPARFAGLAAVLRVLIGEARKRRADPVVPGLYDLQTWQQLWRAASNGAVAQAAAGAAAQALAAEEAVCPYRGLAAFRQSDSGWFFGRERSTEQLLERLRQAAGDGGGFVVLVGASGAGKSSLLRAGLGPVLAAGTLAAGQTADWPIVAMTPGREPLAELVEHLGELATPVRSAATALDIGVAPATETFAAAVRESARAFAEGAGGPGAGVVLVVDQFEELFTLCADEDERLLFLRALHAMCEPGSDGRLPPALVVLGVRADFYDRCLGYPEIVEATQGRQLALGAMSAQGLSDAVIRPAKAVGLQLERGLVDLMLTDIGATLRRTGRVAAAGYDAGALPLLSHALLATWQRRHGGKLTVDGYRAAGGIHGAVAATAEQAWEALDADGQAAARRILLHLVQVGDTTRDVRRRSTRAELLGTAADPKAAEQAMEVLAAARLVTLDAGAVEISHEALLEAWPRLRSWIDDNRAENLLRQRLESDAAVWDDQGRDASLLYRGARLDSTAQVSGAVEPTSVAREFLAASRRQHRRARWLTRAGVALVCVLALIAAGAAAMAIQQRDEAEFQQIVTESDNLQASDPSLAAQLTLLAHRLQPENAEVNGKLLAAQQLPLATPMRGHSGAVYHTKFRRDGRMLATASEDKTVRLWRIGERGRVTLASKIVTGDRRWVGSAVFSPDGRVLATGGEDGVLRLWDVADPTHPRPLGKPLDGNHGTIFTLAFSPDGHTLATANGDDSVGLWDVADPANAKPRGRALAGHHADVRSVDFSPDGKVLASGSDDHDVRLWEVSDPDHVQPIGRPLRGAADRVHDAEFSPDGRTLAVGVENGAVWLWDVAKPASARPIGVPLTAHEGLVWELAYSPDGRTLASASSDGTTRLWNVAEPAAVAPLGHPIAAPGGIVYAVGFSPDGRSLATGSEDAVARLWSLPPSIPGAHPRGVTAVAVGPGLVATGGADHQVQLWRLGGHLQPIGQPLTGQRGVVGHLDLDANAGLLALGSDDLTVRLWDVSDPAHPRRVGKPLSGSSGVFSPDGTVLAVIKDAAFTLYDVSDPARPRAYERIDSGHAAYLTSAAFSLDGATLATASFDKTVRLWDVSDPDRPRPRSRPLTGHSGPVWAVAFGPGGELATASGDRTVRLWDLRTAGASPRGEPLRGHTDAVNALAFDQDGHRLITGGKDRAVRLWTLTGDTPSSVELTGHTGVVEDVAFTPDGRSAVSGGADGTARLWQLDPRRSIDRICQHTAGVLTEAAWTRLIPALDYDPPC